MAIEYDKQHTVKITPEHQEFMTRLVDSGEFISKAEIARTAIDAIMKCYPEYCEGLRAKRIDRRTSAYRNSHPKDAK